MSPRIVNLLLSVLPLCTGCATYEYELLNPEQFAVHIPRKSEVKVPIDPLEYRLVSYENHLIVRIFNPTDESVQLLGTQSSAVDPNGESHPLRTQTIAPGTFIKLILPPPRPQYRDDGPYIGFGFGVIGSASRSGFYDPFYGTAIYDQPRYYTVYDDADNFYWDWHDESTARLLLTFQRPAGNFHHDFTFRRRKV